MGTGKVKWFDSKKGFGLLSPTMAEMMCLSTVRILKQKGMHRWMKVRKSNTKSDKVKKVHVLLMSLLYRNSVLIEIRFVH